MADDQRQLDVLLACMFEAIRRQPPAIRDQLDAAVREGNVAFRPGPDAVTLEIDGRAVADVPYAVLA